MKRFIANYMLVPGRGVLNNHILTINDLGQMVSLTPLNDELAYTIYISDTVAIVCNHDEQKLLDSFSSIQNQNELKSLFIEGNFNEVNKGLTLSIFKFDFKSRYIEKLS